MLSTCVSEVLHPQEPGGHNVRSILLCDVLPQQDEQIARTLLEIFIAKRQIENIIR